MAGVWAGREINEKAPIAGGFSCSAIFRLTFLSYKLLGEKGRPPPLFAVRRGSLAENWLCLHRGINSLKRGGQGGDLVNS